MIFKMAKCERCPTEYLSGGAYDRGLCAECRKHEARRQEAIDEANAAEDVGQGRTDGVDTGGQS